MKRCRASTLALLQNLKDDEYYLQAHPDFSPVGWHLGHIALIESNWILEHLAHQACICPQYRRLLTADGLPKHQRQNLPRLDQVLSLLQETRQRVWCYLEKAPVDQQGRLWWWLLQHESQHAETICVVLAMHRHQQPVLHSWRPTGSVAPSLTPQIHLPAATIALGYGNIDALDNEQPHQTVRVDDFWMDVHPVTQGQYRAFMTAGGYRQAQWWSAEGWQWQQRQSHQAPRYWHDDPAWDEHPVCGVSWYEAEAYARFVGKRLPTEAEWERAACWDRSGSRWRLYPWGNAWPQADRCNHMSSIGTTTPVRRYPAGTMTTGLDDLIGNVWEWTASWFDGYANPQAAFQPFPYRGYSQAYFDGQHRVLRGGSWATRPWALRGTLRNWYHPHVRQILAGFRCARSSSGLP